MVNEVITGLSFDIRAVAVLPMPSGEDFLVVSTSSGVLLVLRIFANGSTPLVMVDTKMNNGVQSGIDGIGHNVQADFEGRFIAVTALQDSIVLMSIGYDNDTLSGEMKIQDLYNLKLEDSVILHSCFLNQNDELNSKHVYYFVLYATPPMKLKIAMYDWNSNSPLKSANLSCLPLSDIGTPLYLIPVSTVIGGAVIVTENKLYLVKASDAVNGNVILVNCDLHHYPLSYFRDPYIKRKGKSDEFMLMCEPFIIYNVFVTSDSIEIVETVIRVNQFVPGSSFTVHAFDGEKIIPQAALESERIAVTYGGDTSCGGWFEAVLSDDDDRWLSPHDSDLPDGVILLFQEFDNYSPVNDFQLIDLPSTNQQQLYIASGQGNRGALSLLQYGIGMNDHIDLSGLDVEGLTDLLVVKNDFVNYLVFTFVARKSSTIMSFEYEGNNIAGLEVENDYDGQIIAIGLLPGEENVKIFVTPACLVLEGGETRREESLDNVTHASILNEYVLISSATVDYTNISLYRLNGNNDDWIELVNTWQLSQSVTMISLVKLGNENEIRVIVGLISLQLLTAGIKDAKLVSVGDLTEYNDAIPSCIEHTSNGYLLGLRNGQLGVLDIEFKIKAFHNIGAKPVKKMIKISDKQEGYLVLGERLVVLTFDGAAGAAAGADAPNDSGKLLSVLSTTDISLELTAIAVTKVENDGRIQLIRYNNDLQISTIDIQKPRVITRPVANLQYTPKRLCYLSENKMFAVAMREYGNNMLKFISPFKCKQYLKTLVYKSREGDEREFHKNEQVTAICEWDVKVGEKSTKYLVMATSINQTDGIIRAMVIKIKNGSYQLIEKFKSREKGMITSLTTTNNNALIYTTSNDNNRDNKLTIRVMEVADNGRCKLSEALLSPSFQSQGTQITIMNDNVDICVATHKNSLIIFNWSNNELTMKEADMYERQITAHCVVDDDRNMLVFDEKRRMTHLVRRTYTNNETVPTLMNHEYTILPSVVIKAMMIDYSKLWDAGDTYGRAMLAAGFDGSFYAFKMFNEDEKSKLSALVENDQHHDKNKFVTGTKWNDTLETRFMHNCDLSFKKECNVAPIFF